MGVTIFENGANGRLNRRDPVPRNVGDAGATGDGQTDDYLAIRDASLSQGSVGGIFFPPGTYRVGTNLTINCEAIFALGATLEPDAGVTVTLAGPVTTANEQGVVASGALGTVTITGAVSPLGVVNVKTLGAIGNNVADDTSAIQRACTFAASNGFKTVYFPSGTYVVSSTITVGRISLKGEGDSSRIRPTITDGSACLNVTVGTNLFSIIGLRVDNGIAQDDFTSGLVNGQNCTGIRISSSGGTFSARFWMRDVIVRGCKIGYDMAAFIATLDNVWALLCETGFKGTDINSSRLHLRIENCRKDLEITNSAGIHFDQLICEGVAQMSGLVTSTIDDVRGCVFTGPYFEQSRNVPFIAFGGTTLCNNIELLGVAVSMPDNASATYDTYPFTFDRVNGLNITGFFTTGQNQKRYSTTTNTLNITENTSAAGAGNFGPNDNSARLGVVYNHFPNSNFDLWLRGYPAVTVTRATIAQETTIVRRGNNALRLTVTAGQPNGLCNFIFNDSWLGVKLRGKTVTAYAWVWVPNTSDFNPTPRSSIPTQVALNIFTDGTGGTTTSSAANSINRGAWNLMRVNVTVPTDATRIDIFPQIIATDGSASGTEFIIVDSMFLVEGTGHDVAVRNGWVRDSGINPCRVDGGLMSLRADSAPSDPDQVFEVGDHVWRRTVAAGGSPGWVCTTGGAGGVAVFKTMASVAP